MKIGYARVSTEDQSLDLQLSALKEADCEVVFQDYASGSKKHRKGLLSAIELCGEGDTLIAWKLDRLSRSLQDLMELAETLRERGAGLKILTGQGAMIDTSKAEGRMIFAIFGALAEFERELIRERTKAGMQAAKKRGAAIGRPRKILACDIRRASRKLQRGRVTQSDMAEELGVSLSTLQRALKLESSLPGG